MAVPKKHTNGETPRLSKAVPAKKLDKDDADKPTVTNLPNTDDVMPESDHHVDGDLTDKDGNATHSTTTPDDFTELSDEDKKTYQTQFPSLEGKPELEVAKRSTDTDSMEATVYTKKFVARFHGPVELDEDFHTKQITAMRREAIGVGLRLTGDGRYVGADPHPDGKSTILTYEVPCVPAKVADELASHQPPDEDYAHKLAGDHEKSMAEIPAGDETKKSDDAQSEVTDNK